MMSNARWMRETEMRRQLATWERIIAALEFLELADGIAAADDGLAAKLVVKDLEMRRLAGVERVVLA